MTVWCRFVEEKCQFPTDPQTRFVPIEPLDSRQGLRLGSFQTVFYYPSRFTRKSSLLAAANTACFDGHGYGVGREKTLLSTTAKRGSERRELNNALCSASGIGCLCSL